MAVKVKLACALSMAFFATAPSMASSIHLAGGYVGNVSSELSQIAEKKEQAKVDSREGERIAREVLSENLSTDLLINEAIAAYGGSSGGGYGWTGSYQCVATFSELYVNIHIAFKPKPMPRYYTVAAAYSEHHTTMSVPANKTSLSVQSSEIAAMASYENYIGPVYSTASCTLTSIKMDEG